MTPDRTDLAREVRRARPAPRGARGFTLIEMIVAVGILAAVVATLFGTFFRARNEISRIGTLVNTRQSARATNTSTSDGRCWRSTRRSWSRPVRRCASLQPPSS